MPVSKKKVKKPAAKSVPKQSAGTNVTLSVRVHGRTISPKQVSVVPGRNGGVVITIPAPKPKASRKSVAFVLATPMPDDGDVDVGLGVNPG